MGCTVVTSVSLLGHQPQALETTPEGGFYQACTPTPVLVYSILFHLQVNHFPGSSCFVSKPRLATHGFPYTPKAFRIPEDADKFKEEVK